VAYICVPQLGYTLRVMVYTFLNDSLWTIRGANHVSESPTVSGCGQSMRIMDSEYPARGTPMSRMTWTNECPSAGQLRVAVYIYK